MPLMDLKQDCRFYYYIHPYRSEGLEIESLYMKIIGNISSGAFQVPAELEKNPDKEHSIHGSSDETNSSWRDIRRLTDEKMNAAGRRQHLLKQRET